MQSSAKYLIHATIRTSGVVERSDVVGAIFGQTEGLLGDGLDLRDLQEASKVGRIDVNIESEGGRSIGSVTIASGLDKVETAVLAAALETMDRVGPCHADCTVTEIEDAREAKRRTIVERATELLDELEETTVTSEQIIDEVRKNARIDEITEYNGYPAGPHVESSDAIIIVEGRADVRQLLKYGIKNAVAVEGTDVPATIAELTVDRNTTAFLDGDRGGDLILRELQQVGDVDYVAFAPTDQSVEDLDRSAILSALRRKVPTEQVPDGQSPREVFCPRITGEDESSAEPPPSNGTESKSNAESDGGQSVVERVTAAATEQDLASGQSPVPASESKTDDTPGQSPPEKTAPVESNQKESTDGMDGTPETETRKSPATDQEKSENEEGDTTGETTSERKDDTEPRTLAGHVEAVIGNGTARFVDEEFATLADVDSEEAFERLVECEQPPATIVLDGTLTQKLLDGAAQRGVGQIVAAEFGEFVKRPTDVRIRTASDRDADT
jgi:DNA primase